MPTKSSPFYAARRVASIAAIALIAAGSSRSSGNLPLHDLRSVRALSPQQASAKLPVRLAGVVTTVSGWKDSFFFQDASAGISVDRDSSSPSVAPGTFVEVTGVTGPGRFAPVIVAQKVRLLGKKPLPPAPLLDVSELSAGQQDSQRISLRAVIRSVQLKTVWNRPVLLLRLQTPSGRVTAHVLNFNGSGFESLVDSEVLIRGVCGTKFNGNGQIVGIRLFVPQLSDVVVEKPSRKDPFSAPLQAFAELFRFGQATALQHRIHFSGVVTYQAPDGELYVEQNGRAALIHTEQKIALPPGTVIEAAGFSVKGPVLPTFENALIRVIGKQPSPAPVRVRADQVLLQNDGFTAVPQNGLPVTIRAEVIEQIRTPAGDMLILRQGSAIFRGRLRLSGSQAPAISAIRRGSIVDATGICALQTDVDDDPSSFYLLLRSPADIRLIQAASWWKTRHVLWILALTALVALLALGSAAAFRKRLTQQARVLQRSETLFRNTLDNLPLLVVGLDANGRVAFCNDALLTALGRGKEDLIGKTWDGHFVSPNCVDDDSPMLLDKEAMRVRHENYLFGQADEKRFVSWYNTLLQDDGGRFAGTVSVGEDVTKRKQVEEALTRASEAAASASRAKSEFLANMSHEIRTPMNGIIGLTDLVLESSLTADQRENLEMVKASADGLLTIINDILDFSKIEAGKLALDPTLFNLEDVVWESLKNVAVSAHAKGIELTGRIADDIPVEVVGDPGRLRQVLLNLLGNALKFTERGEVRLELTLDGQAEHDPVVHFCISDTGIGMSAEQQAKIFRAFSQAEISIARQFGGTGLGLTISSRLVQMFGGRIWVQSALGEGSQFHFTARFGLAQRLKRPSAVLIPDGLRVLVLDDHPLTRQILIDALALCGVHSTPIGTGRLAIEEIRQAAASAQPYDLMIVDLHMPDMDGFEVVRQVRNLPHAPAIKIILLTAVGQRGDAATCKELGIQSYLRKPLKPSELRRCVSTVMQAPVASQTPLVTRHTLREDRLRILLAEDGLVNQRLAVKLLEKHGHAVTVANNGQEALDFFDRENFDLIFMDIEMPILNGLETAKIIRIREQDGRQRTRIIAMTAHAMQGDRERFLSVGMDAYISKPIRAEELYHLLAS